MQVHHSPENHGFALGNNLALAQATGDVVVFLNNDTTVPPGWLAPLREALTDDDVLGAQPLLLYPTGSIQSAGVAFPTCGGLPHAFLRGFPAEDAYGVEGLRFQALTGAALALRFSDAVALRGFDPVFTNGMEDVDLCHRLRQLRQETTGPLPRPRQPARGAPRVRGPRAGTTSTWPTAPSTSTAGSGWSSLATMPRCGPLAGCAWSTTTSARPGTVPRRGYGSRGRCWSARPGSRSPRPRGCAGRSRTQPPPDPAESDGATPTSPRPWPRRSATTARRWSSTGAPSGTGPPAATTMSCSCCAAWSATTPAPSRCRCSG